METQHGFGWIPDVPDARDLQFSALSTLGVLPEAVDLRPMCSPVRDQGNLGACTGFALAVGLREFWLHKDKQTFAPLSPLWVYYQERKIEHTLAQDSGAMLRDGLKTLAKLGCAPESDDPYNIIKFTNAPTKQAVQDATNYKIKSYARLHSLADVRACLAGGNVCVLGFTVYASFESAAVAKTGKMPMPQPHEKILGGHAVCAVGYQTDANAPGGGWLVVKNSWGMHWGDKGYFYMPYGYVTSALVSDIWSAQA